VGVCGCVCVCAGVVRVCGEVCACAVYVSGVRKRERREVRERGEGGPMKENRCI